MTIRNLKICNLHMLQVVYRFLQFLKFNFETNSFFNPPQPLLFLERFWNNELYSSMRESLRYPEVDLMNLHIKNSLD